MGDFIPAPFHRCFDIPDDTITIMAPFGLDDIFSFRVVPNHALMNRLSHEKKAARAKAMWPEVTVVPW